MKCPDCENGRILMFFPVYAPHVPPEDRKPVLEGACFRCHGTCEITEEEGGWILAGRAMKTMRLARGVGMRAEADRRGMKCSEYAAMENGRVLPVLAEPAAGEGA